MKSLFQLAGPSASWATALESPTLINRLARGEEVRRSVISIDPDSECVGESRAANLIE